MTVITLPPVGSIEGVQLHNSGSTDPATHRVEIQYTDRTPAKNWHSLTMPLLDALYLLNLLEQASKLGGFEHLRHPPGTPQ